MPVTPSPLRYPGGKTKLYSYITKILDLNDLHGTYIEPFAGGAGLAIKLLLSKDVKRIVINDSDRAIYSFWKCVLHHTEELCDFIETVPITYEEWERQREIYRHQELFDEVDIGKAALFLNRTNVSGILKGGVIGGKEQNGKFLMDARFNKGELINKIRTIAKYSQFIDVYNLDVFDFLSSKGMRHYYKAFVNFDPPYVIKGGQLYMNSFTEEDHKKLRDVIVRSNRKWIVTYDVCDLTACLYGKYRKSYIDVTYSANQTRTAKEFIFFSDNLILPDDTVLL